MGEENVNTNSSELGPSKVRLLMAGFASQSGVLLVQKGDKCPATRMPMAHGEGGLSMRFLSDWCAAGQHFFRGGPQRRKL